MPSYSITWSLFVLTFIEKIILTILIIAALLATWRATLHLARIIGRGYGKVDWSLASKRMISVLKDLVVMRPTLNLRLGVGVVHLVVVWGFALYLLVNLGDVLQGYIADFHFLGAGLIGNLFRLGADLLSIGVIVGIVVFFVRRFVFKPENLVTRQSTMLHEKARFGILRDSAIIVAFALIHVGARFLGESFLLALEGPDVWQPFASAVSSLWIGWGGLEVARHAAYWVAITTVMAIIPYFPYTKHVHLVFAPLSFLLKPERRSIGELSAIDFEDEELEQFGATNLSDLSWPQLMDAYACIMCYRCQEVCPAYTTGKLLSPAALEINKRYYFNYDGAAFAEEKESEQPLVEWAIPTEAVWACTACGACVDICPVNNDPMLDIMDIRRAQVLMDNDFPTQLQAAFRGMERAMNPWGVPQNERMKWAKGLDVPTIEDNPEPDVLWWVGCAPATDARAQKTAVAFAKILNAAGVNYAVLGEAEMCTGDSARRAGREDVFYELAVGNIEVLNEVAPQRIITTCPHCLHTLMNEYPAYGGNFEVVHHTQFIQELLEQGKLSLQDGAGDGCVTYHDPCYLSRHNDITSEPRKVLGQVAGEIVELDRREKKTFCCGAGGAQVWKEEEHGVERISDHRFKEVVAAGADVLALGCPFCMTMLTDAAKDAGSDLKVLDLAEMVADRLQE
jgi:Fe-S oxidoreductase